MASVVLWRGRGEPGDGEEGSYGRGDSARFEGSGIGRDYGRAEMAVRSGIGVATFLK